LAVVDADIQAFLRRFWQAMDAHGLAIWKNKKNDDFLMETGFTNDDVVAVVTSLRTSDYHAGPEPDERLSRPPGEVWVFAREYEGYEMYIKLKLTHELDMSTAVPSTECMSFHEAEHPMSRPNARCR